MGQPQSEEAQKEGKKIREEGEKRRKGYETTEKGQGDEWMAKIMGVTVACEPPGGVER